MSIYKERKKPFRFTCNNGEMIIYNAKLDQSGFKYDITWENIFGITKSTTMSVSYIEECLHSHGWSIVK